MYMIEKINVKDISWMITGVTIHQMVNSSNRKNKHLPVKIDTLEDVHNISHLKH